MKDLKKIFALSIAMAMLSSIPSAHAECPNDQAETGYPCVEYSTDAGGCGYQECRRAPCIAPAIALGTIALIAIIAVAVQNSHGGGGHDHAHNECE